MSKLAPVSGAFLMEKTMDILMILKTAGIGLLVFYVLLSVISFTVSLITVVRKRRREGQEREA